MATPLISMGALLGKTTYMQLVFMGILELIAFTVNKYVGEHLLMVSQSHFLPASRSIFGNGSCWSLEHAEFPSRYRKRSSHGTYRELCRDRVAGFYGNGEIGTRGAEIGEFLLRRRESFVAVDF